MSLSIIGECRVQGSRGIVVIEGETIGEVNSPLAKSAALQAATTRLSRPGIAGQSGAYAVDDNGEPVPLNGADGRPMGLPAGSRFRQEFQIQAGI